jgi:hypothetical protein
MPIYDPSYGLSVSDHDSSSAHQMGQLSYTGQQIETHLDNPEQYAAIATPHPAVNSIGTPSNLGNTIQGTQGVFCGQTPTHPSVNPDWLQAFNEWFPTQRQRMMSVQGIGDPILCQFIWARVFGWGIQLLSTQGFGDPPVLPRYWNDMFDLCLQHLLKPVTPALDDSHTSIYPASSAGPLTSLLRTPHAPNISSSSSKPPALKDRKRTLNVESSLTPQEIQETCRKNGVDDSTIARIAVVFPDIVSREQLMLVKRPGSAVGGERNHKGYMEFAERCMVDTEDVRRTRSGTGTGRVQRYYCKLCGRDKRPRWKNSKDVLGHVWDTHCIPQDDGTLSLSFGICAWD